MFLGFKSHWLIQRHSVYELLSFGICSGHYCTEDDISAAHKKLPHLLEVLVTVDVLLVMRVLQLVGLDVLPEGLNDAGASLSVNAKQARQARVQLKLGRLWRRYNRITTLFFLYNRPPQSLYISPITSDILIAFPRLGNGYQVSKWSLKCTVMVL